jgi:hypothetical protein
MYFYTRITKFYFTDVEKCQQCPLLLRRVITLTFPHHPQQIAEILDRGPPGKGGGTINITTLYDNYTPN